MKKETEIKIYLSYTFKNIEQEEDINRFLECHDLKDFKYHKTKIGHQVVESPSIVMFTRCVDDLTSEFLNIYSKKIDLLNSLAETFDGFFVLSIVLELYKKLAPQLGFNKSFLNFLLSLKNFTDIDIDQYIY